MQCRDGSWKWIRARGAVMSVGANGRPTRLQGFVTDISQYRASSDQLVKSHVVLAELSPHLPHVFFYQFQRFSGGRCTVPYASDAIEALYGVRAADVIDNAAPLFERVHRDDIEYLRHSMKASAQALHVWHMDYRVTLDGKERRLFGEAYPVKQADDSVMWHGFLVDITLRRQQEQYAQILEQQLFATLQFSRLGIVDILLPSGAGYFNPEYARALGLSQDFLHDAEKFWPYFWRECIHPEDSTSFKLTLQTHVKSRSTTPFQSEFRVRTKSGEWRWWLSASMVTEWDDKGRAVRIIGTHMDVTEKKKIEQELHHFEDILRSGRDRYKKLASELEILFTHFPVGIMLVHKDKVIRANPTLARLLKYQDPKELMGVAIESMHQSAASYHTLRAELAPRLKEHGVLVEATCILKTLDGSDFTARLVGRALPTEYFSDTSIWLIEVNTAR